MHRVDVNQDFSNCFLGFDNGYSLNFCSSCSYRGAKNPAQYSLILWIPFDLLASNAISFHHDHGTVPDVRASHKRRLQRGSANKRPFCSPNSITSCKIEILSSIITPTTTFLQCQRHAG